MTFTHTEAALMRNNKVANILTNFNLDKFILQHNPGILNRVATYLDLKNTEEFPVNRDEIQQG